ncbi:aminopeptidase [Paracidovorax oryzae]|uniref:aminopeptidase n=1 Tax=Paracidovorax oryzae TaxID=862720 RepID=UPI00047BEC39|nr:aminopeptidase [Paracidovorax oryzae]
MTSLIPSTARTARLAAAGLAGALLAGCAHTGDTLGYYWQSVRGHLQIMRAAEPVDDWIARPGTAAPLRARLELAQQARAFAVAELHLPDNASYRRYADLGRRAAVWNVVAAPPDSLTLHTWCFPITGCIGYRGYFAEGDARAEAARLAAGGLETAVYGVPAYSTLGYTNWLGGDPLLNTFIGWPEGDFVRLLFHELAHQVVYANGDTMFNESFATAVERLGVARWLAERATPQARAEYALGEERRAAFRALARGAREQLAELYARSAGEGGQPGLQEHKREAMERFRTRYARLRAGWLAQGTQPAQIAGYDRWVAEANNAAFGAQAAYDDLVPAFEELFRREGGDWPRFYQAVRRLAALPPDERKRELRAALPASGDAAPPPAAD